jgi:hypothetical protein
MRTIACLFVACSSTAAQDGALFTLSGANPVLHRVATSTGAVLDSHNIVGAQASLGGLAYDSRGWLYCIDGLGSSSPARLVRIDTITGALTVIGPTGFNWQRAGLFWPNFCCSRLFAVADNSLYIIEETTGQATFQATLFGSPRLDQVTAFAAHTHGNFAFITDTIDTDLFSLNVTNGQVTWIGSIGGSADPFNDLTFASAPVSVHGVRSSGGIYRINTTTAAQTFAFPGNYTALEHAFNASPGCYANCDGSTIHPVLTPNDFLCFFTSYVNNGSYANCTGGAPGKTSDFICFVNAYAGGCY